MFVRVVRFTDVEPDHMAAMVARIESSGGPPEGMTISELRVLHDTDQRTAVVLQIFATAEDMAAAEEMFSSMDAGDTPGTRASVDRCATALEMTV